MNNRPFNLFASLVVLVMFGTLSIAQTKEEDSSIDSSASTLPPLLKQYCFECHSGDEANGDVSLDSLAVAGPNLNAESWSSVLDVINSGDMPPEDEPQLSNDHRKQMVDSLNSILRIAAESKTHDAPMLRRLTRAQYTNTLQALLGLSVDFGDVLPEDGKSEMGFSNNAEVLQTTSLHFDYYEKVARSALGKAIFTGTKPDSTRFRIEMGRNIDIDPETSTGQVIKGYQSVPIPKEHFRIELLDEIGNVRKAVDEEQEEAFNEFKGNIGLGMRGSATDRFQVVDDGILLFSAVPHREQVPKSWQGPSPNLKVLIQDDFTHNGDFRLKVSAVSSQSWGGSFAKDRLITLREHVPAKESRDTIKLSANKCKRIGEMKLRDQEWLIPIDVADTTFAHFPFKVETDGIYQVDFVHPYVNADLMPSFEVRIDGNMKLQERLQMSGEQRNETEITAPITLVKLKKGRHRIRIGGQFFTGFKEIRITPLDPKSETVKNLQSEALKNQENFSAKQPSIAAFAGARTDDGMDYLPFGQSQTVDAKSGEPKELIFQGRLENMPLPVFQKETRDKLSNISIFGIWNNYLVKNVNDSGPPVLIKSIELELPYFPAWPPKSHTDIFPIVDSKTSDSKAAAVTRVTQEDYTKEVLDQFITRAFRRPVSTRELERYFGFWKSIRDDFDVYEDGVKEVLVAVLCSPNFLYVLEPTDVADASNDLEPADVEPVDQFLLASKLAYFLWNSPPDETLLKLAHRGQLYEELSAQTDRMIEDPKVLRMIRSFAGEWLRVDRHENIRIDPMKYPDFTRFVKSDMSEETWNFLNHVLQNDLSVDNLIDSDFAMLNQNLAEFYGVAGVEGNDFRAVKISPDQHRGGLLSQGAFLAGHSDGQQAHPIKRAVWLKEKILGDPPPPPPPNVPDLDPETPGFENLTLKEQLELHRNKPSCISCHKKIDPYGIVFQNFDAVGRFQSNSKGKPIDSISTLPDGTKIDGVAEMKRYILEQRHQQFHRSLVEHLLAYGLGRDIKFADQAEVDDIVQKIEAGEGGFRSVFREIVLSPSFSGQNYTRE